MQIVHEIGYTLSLLILLGLSANYTIWFLNWISGEIDGTWRNEDKWGVRKLIGACTLISLVLWGGWTWWGFKAGFLSWVPSLLCSSAEHLQCWLNCAS